MLILERIPGRGEQLRVSRMIEGAAPHPLHPPLRREDSDRLLPAAAERAKLERACRSNTPLPQPMLLVDALHGSWGNGEGGGGLYGQSAMLAGRHGVAWLLWPRPQEWNTRPWLGCIR
jgi:hypothetical protein